jgi:hypothetical protein
MAQVNFDQFFENSALRINYYLAGNQSSQSIYIDDMAIEPYWSGNRSKTIDNLNFGTHRIEVRVLETGNLIYSQGFCTLFQEWQTVDEAKHVQKAFEQVARIPLPKQMVSITFLARQNGEFAKIYKFNINPHSPFISRTPQRQYPTTKLVDNGDPSKKLDIAFIAEGYQLDQMAKFRTDVMGFANHLFSQAPFDELKDKINIWAIESVSESDGPTNPGTKQWNTTAVESSFYTFGIERYLTTTRYKKVMDIAANAPGDVVYIIVNTAEYGGGGIYNHYNVTTADHPLSSVVFIHELGHGLAGLGDEYFTSEVAYNDFYPLNIEPWEPNLTTLVAFERKWANLVDSKTPIPTPATADFNSVIGVFEGGGYAFKGVFRPYIDCRMMSNTAKSFCPVCQEAIKRVVYTYCD